VHKIFHPLPKFIHKCDPNKELYDPTKGISNDLIKRNALFTAEWKYSHVIYDSQKSSRNQEPVVFSHIYSQTLVFESRFESGNLRQVKRVYD
jgi:hypothetical protein